MERPRGVPLRLLVAATNGESLCDGKGAMFSVATVPNPPKRSGALWSQWRKSAVESSPNTHQHTSDVETLNPRSFREMHHNAAFGLLVIVCMHGLGFVGTVSFCHLNCETLVKHVPGGFLTFSTRRRAHDSVECTILGGFMHGTACISKRRNSCYCRFENDQCEHSERPVGSCRQ